jgi:hypothetical protein
MPDNLVETFHDDGKTEMKGDIIEHAGFSSTGQLFALAI